VIQTNPTNELNFCVMASSNLAARWQTNMKVAIC